jgi:hypothetical protein
MTTAAPTTTASRQPTVSHLDAVRHVCAPQLRDACEHRVGHVDGVLAGLFRHCERDGRRGAMQFDALQRGGWPCTERNVLLGLVRAEADGSDVLQVNRAAVAHGDDQLGDVLAVREERAGLHGQVAFARHHRTGVADHVGSLQRPRQFADGQPVASQLLRIECGVHDLVRPPDGVHVARARHALQLGFDRVRDLLQLVRAALLVACPERQAEDRDIVDAFRLHQRLQDADAWRTPVLVRIDRVPESYDRARAFLADLELHGQHGYTW